MTEETEENSEKPHPKYSMFDTKLETGTSRMPVRSIIDLASSFFGIYIYIYIYICIRGVILNICNRVLLEMLIIVQLITNFLAFI
jgi:hypothetical protein